MTRHDPREWAKQLVLASLRWPNASMRMARLFGAMTYPLDRSELTRGTIEGIARLLPELSKADLRRIRRQRGAAGAQDWLIKTAAYYERALPLKEIVRSPDLAARSRSMVAVTLHIGPYYAIPSVLKQLAEDPLVLHRQVGLSFEVGARLRYVADSEADRVTAMHEAVRTLRAGSAVFLLPDGGLGDGPLCSTMLRRPVRLQRGAFALARMTNAPMVPLAARWTSTGIQIEAGAAIPPGNEDVMAASLSAWFDGWLRAHPEEIGPWFTNILGLTSFPL